MRPLASVLQPGYTQFFDYDQPGLPAGSYEISVTQALPNAATSQFSRTVTQRFVADGPQFTLDTAEIHTMFPPPNANGSFAEVLPNIMLENPKLPWERGITANADVPWLALLVFAASEITLGPQTDSPLITGSVQDFLAAQAGVVKPAINPATLSAPTLASSMNSIRVSTAVFQAVTPRLVELASLAHVREIDPEFQPVGESGANPWYSVVLANRFPDSVNAQDQAGAVNYVHLVSLEGLADYLVDAPAWPAGAQAVQLVSLANWRFVSVGQTGQTFADLAENLISSTGGDPEQLLLRIPTTADGSAAAARIGQGFTALSYHTLPGPDTFAWYRGPFCAAPPQPLPSTTGPCDHPSGLEIYDQAHGIFDQSYAAAWTIGRLAALADPEFIDSLQQTRGRILGIGRTLLERAKMPHLAGLSLAELAAPGATRKRFGAVVVDGMGARLTGALQPGAAAPARADGAAKFRAPAARIAPRANHLLDGMTAAHGPAMELRAFLAHPPVAAFLTAQVAPTLDPMAEWLAKLVLLYNIPFNHLVPDQRMLPVESIRFFYVDRGWLTAMAEAAMTIGVHGTRDRAVNALVAPELWQRAQRKVPQVRRKLLRKPMLAAGDALPPMPAAGMLLRSELVSGWPGLQIVGTAAGTPVNAMRIDRLAPNIMLVLWDAVPDTVTLGQPQQSIAFGVENGEVALRSLATANLGQQTGGFYPTGGTISQFYRPPAAGVGGRVLQLVPATAGTPNYLLPGLQQALSQSAALSPAQFAIEMVNAPQQVDFNPPGGGR